MLSVRSVQSQLNRDIGFGDLRKSLVAERRKEVAFQETLDFVFGPLPLCLIIGLQEQGEGCLELDRGRLAVEAKRLFRKDALRLDSGIRESDYPNAADSPTLAAADHDDESF